MRFTPLTELECQSSCASWKRLRRKQCLLFRQPFLTLCFLAVSVQAVPMIDDHNHNLNVPVNLPEKYEIVIPHIWSSEPSQSSTLSTIKVDLQAFGQPFTLSCKQLANFFADDYVFEQSSPSNASMFEKRPGKRCHYEGVVDGHTKSHALISFCNGALEGHWLVSGDVFFISRYKHANSTVSDPASQHIVSRQSILANDDEKVPKCNVVSPLLESARPIISTSSLAARDSRVNLKIWLIADSSMWIQYGSELQDRMESIFAGAQQIFKNGNAGDIPFSPPINLQLSRITIWTEANDQNTVDVTTNAEAYLRNFCKWVQQQKQQGLNFEFDIAHLITFVDVLSSSSDVVGLAYFETACTSSACSLVQDVNPNSVSMTAQAVAHEIGHNLAAIHDGDGNDCNQNDYVMSPFSNVYSSTWSKCSVESINTFISNDYGVPEFCDSSLSVHLSASLVLIISMAMVVFFAHGQFT